MTTKKGEAKFEWHKFELGAFGEVMSLIRVQKWMTNNRVLVQDRGVGSNLGITDKMVNILYITKNSSMINQIGPNPAVKLICSIHNRRSSTECVTDLD